jgi:phage recombination protein Bet
MSSNELVIQKEGQDYPEVNIGIEDVKKYIAPNATDKELYMFMNIARSYGLNPFKREVHFCKYGNSPGQVIVGYETYIKRAERTGKLEGWSVWCTKDDIGEKAVIEIHRKDRKYPFRWEVYRREFDKQQSTWKAMPYFMLKKVAISQGFRLAFPEEVGGMPYTPDEINAGTSESLPKDDVVDAEYTTALQNGTSEATESKKTANSTQQSEQEQKSQNTGSQQAGGPTQKQMNAIRAQCSKLQRDPHEVASAVTGFEIQSLKELTGKQASQIIEAINKGNIPQQQSATEQMDDDPFAPVRKEESSHAES